MSSSAGKRWEQNRCLYGRQHRTTDCCQGLITSLYHCMQLHGCRWSYTGFHWLGDCTFLALVSSEPLSVHLHQRCQQYRDKYLSSPNRDRGVWSLVVVPAGKSPVSERGQERGCMQGVFMYGPSTKNATAASNTTCKSSSTLTVLIAWAASIAFIVHLHKILSIFQSNIDPGWKKRKTTLPK